MATKDVLLTQNKRKWKSDFFGCCSYRNPKGDCMWCPFFCPMAVMSTCCLIGKLETKLAGEEQICFDMGVKGGICCFVSNAIMGPPGFMLLGCCIRSSVVKKYNVDDSEDTIINKICFPCSYFQMYVSTVEWDEEDAEKVKASAL